jgi:hypothetical protein
VLVHRSASAFGSQPGSAAFAEPGSTAFGPRGSGRLSADILPQHSAAAGPNSLAAALSHQQSGVQHFAQPNLTSSAGSAAGLMGPPQLHSHSAQQSLWGARGAPGGQPGSGPVSGAFGGSAFGRASPLSGGFAGSAASTAFAAPGGFGGGSGSSGSGGSSYPASSGLAAPSVGRASGGLPGSAAGSTNAIGGNRGLPPNYGQPQHTQQPGNGFFAGSQDLQPQHLHASGVGSGATGVLGTGMSGSQYNAAGAPSYSGGFGASAYTSFLNLLPQLHQQQAAQQPQVPPSHHGNAVGGPLSSDMPHSTRASSVSRSSGFAQHPHQLY